MDASDDVNAFDTESDTPRLTYKVFRIFPFRLRCTPTTPITFQCHNACSAGTPLPHFKLIALHAVVATVLHTSGIGEQFNRVLDLYSPEGLNSGFGRDLGGGQTCHCGCLYCLWPKIGSSCAHKLPKGKVLLSTSTLLPSITHLRLWSIFVICTTSIQHPSTHRPR